MNPETRGDYVVLIREELDELALLLVGAGAMSEGYLKGVYEAVCEAKNLAEEGIELAGEDPD